jgi:hypothetical protein
MTASTRSLALAVLAGVVLQSAACAPRAVRVLQTVHAVEVKLAAPDDRLYLLVDPHRRVLAAAAGTNGTLRFRLPFPEASQQCLSVRASSAQSADPVKGALSFRATLIERHASLAASRRDVLRGMARNDALISAARAQDLASLSAPSIDPLELAVTCAALRGDCATDVSTGVVPAPSLDHVADLQRELVRESARIQDELTRLEVLRAPVESCP